MKIIANGTIKIGETKMTHIAAIIAAATIVVAAATIVVAAATIVVAAAKHLKNKWKCKCGADKKCPHMQRQRNSVSE